MSNEGSIISALNLGSSKKVLENSTDSPLIKLLRDLTQDVIDELKKSADKYNVQASTFTQEIKPTSSVELRGNTVFVGIRAPFYWKYINYGVNGTEVSHGAPSWGKETENTKSFKENIAEWRSAKGITLPPSFSSYDALDYAIITNVRKKGKEPRPFFTDVVNDKLIQTLKSPIEKLLKRSIEISIIEPWQ